MSSPLRRDGRSKLPEYRTWVSMKQRCQNPRNARYPRYGGRGITVCPVWSEDFTAFLADVGPRPAKHFQLDRINNDGNYEPGNVRWATPQQQAYNRRTNRVKDAYKGTSVTKRYGGQSVSMAQPLTKEAHEMCLQLALIAGRTRQPVS